MNEPLIPQPKTTAKTDMQEAPTEHGGQWPIPSVLLAVSMVASVLTSGWLYVHIECTDSCKVEVNIGKPADEKLAKTQNASRPPATGATKTPVI
jgi:hypothetical protein